MLSLLQTRSYPAAALALGSAGAAQWRCRPSSARPPSAAACAPAPHIGIARERTSFEMLGRCCLTGILQKYVGYLP